MLRTVQAHARGPTPIPHVNVRVLTIPEKVRARRDKLGALLFAAQVVLIHSATSAGATVNVVAAPVSAPVRPVHISAFLFRANVQ